MNCWVLSCSIGHHIEEPKFYKTKEEAVKAMCEDMADFLKLTYEEIYTAREDDGGIYDYAYIGDIYGWCDRPVDGNWRIFNINIFKSEG